LSYVYDHAARDLPKRLTQEAHDHSGLAQATLHVHIDHESCLEVTVLKGARTEVKAFADHVIAERGVRHGHVVMMPIEASHGHAHAHAHSHAAKSGKKEPRE
jgi:CopG family nickel-responsive transcriptional regulator